MKQITQYIAEDGRKFDDKADCELHEKVVCPAAGIIQYVVKSQGIVLNSDTFSKVFAEIMVDKSEQFRNLLSKVGGIKARKNKSKADSPR